MAREEATDNTRRRSSAVSGAARRAGAATGRAAGYTYRRARRAAGAEGAEETGLNRLIELHAFNAAGDAAVAISLAGTLFFQVPTGEARLQVAQFLGLTMLPFAVVAPVIGPLLDRFGHGRRWAIGGTMALRAFLAWVLADAVVNGSTSLFPAALGVLVASKAYHVTRGAAVPRLLPEGLTLVRANARVSLAGALGGAVSAPLALLANLVGPEWSLRYAFVVFVCGTILAVLLPARVDSAHGEEQLALTAGAGGAAGRTRRSLRQVVLGGPVPAAVVVGLRSNAGLRLLSGFLTMFMAFLLREEPLPGWEGRADVLVGLVIGAATVGGTIGIVVGSLLRKAVRPELTVVAALLLDAGAAVVVAVFYGLPTAVVLGVVAGLAQTAGKLSLDALIQREVPDRSRASAFARSETLLQLSWVLGGFLGIAMPLVPRLGLGVAAAILVAWSAFVLHAGRRARTGLPGV